MAQLLIRNLPDEVKESLREQARRNGRSMEAEARTILTSAVDFVASSDTVIEYEGPFDPKTLYRRFGVKVFPVNSGARSMTFEEIRELQHELELEDDMLRSEYGERFTS